MHKRTIPIGELAIVIATRAMIGGGLGLLLGGRLSEERRKSIGWTLLLVGAGTTIPFLVDVFGSGRTVSIGGDLEQPQMAEDMAESARLSAAGGMAF
ncbi:MAG TPA: hypothetical protein VGO93_19945 [Candidatus Xenobia bacterium]